MSERDWGFFCHAKALEIFNISEACLMAHSIRAVEEYIQELKVKHGLVHPQGSSKYSIRFQIKKGFKSKLGSSARAFIHITHTDIYLDSEMTPELMRRGIAHELGHIVIAMEKRVVNNEPLERQKSSYFEDACQIFEKDLCKRHHNHYEDPTRHPKFLFPSLDGYEVPPGPFGETP
jgi:hypothetical protein